MKTKNVLTLVAAAAFAVFAQGTFAQQSPTSKPTAAGSIAPAGQGPGSMTSGPGSPGASAPGMGNSSTTTRSERKSETRAARDSGTLVPAGQGPGTMSSGDTSSGMAAAPGGDKMNKGHMKSDKTRAQRKAQTRADIKSGNTQPAGETPQPAGEAPKK